mgnify:FL=1|jgi:hypothetical protein
MHKQFGEILGTCKVCDINLWSNCDGGPAIFPCGVLNCPHETAEERLAANQPMLLSAQGSSLAQLIEESD